MKETIQTYYSSRRWLNEESSLSTGAVCAFDGKVTYEDSPVPVRHTYLKIMDCHNIATLHTGSYDTIDDFIKKLELLRTDLDSFINYLKSEKCPKE